MRKIITAAALSLAIATPAFAQSAKPAATPSLNTATKPAEPPKPTTTTSQGQQPTAKPAEQGAVKKDEKATGGTAAKPEAAKTTEKPAETKKQ